MKILRWGIVALLVLVASLAAALPASAHPLDETVQQAYLTPSASGLTVELDVSPNVLVAPPFARTLDVDGDGRLSPGEADAHARIVRDALSVTVDGRPVALRPTGQRYPALDLLAAGGGTITLTWVADLPAGARDLVFTNRYVPGRTLVQAAVLSAPDALPVGNIGHADEGRTLSAGLNTAATAAPAAAPALAPAGSAMLDALRSPLASPWALAALLGVCVLLGALHALTPGHGKALLAAYLVGDRGTARHAIGLGLVTTLTHTAAVLALGVAVLAAGRYVLPGVLVPVLTVGAGAVVLVLGGRLVLRRWRAPHTHHDHTHVRPRGIAAMGLSAGIVPCPEALSVLLLAIGLHRTGLGLVMIVAFSVGLAAVLVALGLALVTAGPRLARFAGHRAGRVTARLPLVSALVVVVLGAVMVVSGLSGIAG